MGTPGSHIEGCKDGFWGCSLTCLCDCHFQPRNRMKELYLKGKKYLTYGLMAIALIVPSLIAGYALREVRTYREILNQHESILNKFMTAELPAYEVKGERRSVIGDMSNYIGSIIQRLDKLENKPAPAGAFEI